MAYDELIDRIRIMYKACMHAALVEAELNLIGNPAWRAEIQWVVQRYATASEAARQEAGTQMGKAIRAMELIRPGAAKTDSLRDLIRAVAAARAPPIPLRNCCGTPSRPDSRRCWPNRSTT